MCLFRTKTKLNDDDEITNILEVESKFFFVLCRWKQNLIWGHILRSQLAQLTNSGQCCFQSKTKTPSIIVFIRNCSARFSALRSLTEPEMRKFLADALAQWLRWWRRRQSCNAEEMEKEKEEEKEELVGLVKDGVQDSNPGRWRAAVNGLRVFAVEDVHHDRVDEAVASNRGRLKPAAVVTGIWPPGPG